MMNRIQQRFALLQATGRKGLIPYITAGDPIPWVTVPILHALVEAGADIIELGVPFSDPMSDGPAIQKACERALSNNTSLLHVLDMVAEFRQKDTSTPVVLMGYTNPIESMGYEIFADKAKTAGVDGVLTVDMPPEESKRFAQLMASNAMATIFLVAPTTTEKRIAEITALAEGFIYYVSLKGVTGTTAVDVSLLEDKLSFLKQQTDLPISVGFGIRDGASAAKVAKLADAVVIGSTLVNCIAENEQVPDKIPHAIQQILAEIRDAIDNVSSIIEK